MNKIDSAFRIKSLQKNHQIEMESESSEYAFGNLSTIPCCLCGIRILPNSANMCPKCLSGQVDLIGSLGAQKDQVICGDCGRTLHAQRWLILEPESAELLTLLIKRIEGIPSNCSLKDAEFVWTEPHSMRIRLRIVLEAEILTGTKVRQAGIIEFKIQKQQCSNCRQSFTDKTWSCCLQLRQNRRNHIQSFHNVERHLIDSSLDKYIVSVDEKPQGLDMYFISKSDCKHVLDCLKADFPIKPQTNAPSQQDSTFTYTLELAPLARHDLVLCPCPSKGKSGRSLLLVDKIASSIHLMDPLQCQITDVSNSKYWKASKQDNSLYSVVCSLEQAVEVFVLDVELVNQDDESPGKYGLAEITCIRSSDLGVSENYLYVSSHLGRILKAGDTALAYDLSCMNLSYSTNSGLGKNGVPELILVKKYLKEKKKHQRIARRVQSEMAKEYQSQK